MDYTQLQTDIADNMARQDLPVKSFITNAQLRLNRLLRVQGMIEVETLTPSAQLANGQWYLDLPDGFLELLHVERGGQKLEYVNVNQMTNESETGYTITDEKLVFWGVDAVDVYYYKRIPMLTDAAPTNWFTDNAYDALLFIALGLASAYMGEQTGYMQMGIDYAAEIKEMDDRAAMSTPLVQRG